MFSDSDKEAPVIYAGLMLSALEVWKQAYLYFIYFDHGYDIWYFPFQLCSLPIYLSVIYIWLVLYESYERYFLNLKPDGSFGISPGAGEDAKIKWFKQTILSFLRDFGLLGGIAALLVPDGFTHPDHPLLTLHGYVWHITMVLSALYIALRGLGGTGIKSFLSELWIFFPAALLAEIFNVLFHPLGNCDMFYISPYHLSVQMVFHDIDLVVGRPLGICIYLFAIIVGAYIAYKISMLLSRIMRIMKLVKDNKDNKNI